MSSKIRIIGSFGEEVLDKVTALADEIGGVQYVSLLVEGVEKATATAPPAAEAPAPEPAPEPEPVPEPAPEPAPDAAPAQ